METPWCCWLLTPGDISFCSPWSAQVSPLVVRVFCLKFTIRIVNFTLEFSLLKSDFCKNDLDKLKEVIKITTKFHKYKPDIVLNILYFLFFPFPPFLLPISPHPKISYPSQQNLPLFLTVALSFISKLFICWVFHIREIMPYGIFSVWLTLLSIMSSKCIPFLTNDSNLSSSWPHSSPLCICILVPHLPIHWWAFRLLL